MPGGDGTGPFGIGSRNGMRTGRSNRIGRGFGRMDGEMQPGIDGFCICPKCGTKVKHQSAVPCVTVKCPQCGNIMMTKM